MSNESHIRQLTVENLTVFRSRHEFNFASGLNVFVGENGTGKTHILKAVYAALAVLSRYTPDRELSGALTNKLFGVFKPDEIGGLVSRTSNCQRCALGYNFTDGRSLEISFSKSDVNRVDVSSNMRPVHEMPKIPLPVFLPTRELLSIFPGFVSLYDNRHLPFEETWRDCCSLLDEPLIREPSGFTVNELLLPLEKAMGGKIEQDKTGRFYLRKSNNGRLEIHLVAEGLRKLGMLAKLIASGVIQPGAALFWDEPEANLNPKLAKAVGKLLFQFAQMGVQIFVATHSLFLLKELDILQKTKGGLETECCYFGLHSCKSGVVVKQDSTSDGIGDIAALDEDLEQSNRYMRLD
jgi:Recombinational DNA repair ATPase (RecF pathway)